MGTSAFWSQFLQVLKVQSSIMVAVEMAPSHAVSASHPPSKDQSSTTNHLKEGKRFLLLKDYPSAVESLAEAGENVENPEKMTVDEKEHVGVKVMEALEENFETHQEKINELVYGHTKNDYD